MSKLVEDLGWNAVPNGFGPIACQRSTLALFSGVTPVLQELIERREIVDVAVRIKRTGKMCCRLSDCDVPRVSFAVAMRRCLMLDKPHGKFPHM